MNTIIVTITFALHASLVMTSSLFLKTKDWLPSAEFHGASHSGSHDVGTLHNNPIFWLMAHETVFFIQTESQLIIKIHFLNVSTMFFTSLKVIKGPPGMIELHTVGIIQFILKSLIKDCKHIFKVNVRRSRGFRSLFLSFYFFSLSLSA